MSNIVTRAQFIEACPLDLKKRIDDFFVFYSQKKKQGGGGGGPPPSSSSPAAAAAFASDKRSYSGGGSGGGSGSSGIKRASLNHFKKPFEKSVVSEFDSAHVSFKGILTKLNENNQDSVWKELLALKLEKFIPAAPSAAAAAAAAAAGDDDGGGWSSVVSHKKSAAAAAATTTTGSLAQVKDLAQTMYLYSRNCHMYIKEYVELVARFKQSHEWQMIGTQYIEAVMFDLDNPKAAEQHQYNVLTHSVCSELFLRGLMTKTKYIDCCLVKMGDGTETHTDILIQNMTKCGAVVAENAQVVKLCAAIGQWIKEKKFSGKLHYNLIDLQDTF